MTNWFETMEDRFWPSAMRFYGAGLFGAACGQLKHSSFRDHALEFRRCYLDGRRPAAGELALPRGHLSEATAQTPIVSARLAERENVLQSVRETAA